jgi:UDP-2,4-diacetamido-2,4,6-trideoxy-beta-L-altropyranose hydrolase
VVIDHYGLSAADHRAIADGKPTLVIDDLADRPLAADLVLDSGPARQATDYDGLVPPHAELLLGPHHAPSAPPSPPCARTPWRAGPSAPPVRRILVSLGLTDVGAITGRVVDLMLPLLKDNGPATSPWTSCWARARPACLACAPWPPPNPAWPCTSTARTCRA